MLHTWSPAICSTNYFRILSFILCIILLAGNSFGSHVQQLNNDNFDSVVAQHEIAFINFYADWCRFSQILAPVFEEAATKLAEEFPGSGKILMAKVDCDSESAISSRFQITKYPTLKLIRNGKVPKKEFRGQRSVEGLVSYIREQFKDIIIIHSTADNIESHESKKGSIFGYFEDENHDDYAMFKNVSSHLKDDCEFHAAFGDLAKRFQINDANTVVFKPARTKHGEKVDHYPGAVGHYEDIIHFATVRCIPFVREITFENAEELTEEGLPFLILFHHPEDHDIVKKYTELIQTSLMAERSQVNFLTADGLKFAHPLHHLGKSQKDLPLIAIDSFRHMYLFSDIKEMTTPGRLKAFIDDLYSGKLHREFHYGPDKDGQEGGDPMVVIQFAQHGGQDDGQKQIDGQRPPTSPPESTFRKLAPSKNRYTLLRDEF